MKNPNTPKQTVEAKCKCDVSDDCFMTPIYKDGYCEYCYKHHQAPSPNETPKGEAIKIINRTAMDCNERHCHCHDEEEGRTICTSDMTTCHHCHPELYDKKPAPDKELEKELTGEEALFIGWILSEFYTKGNKTSIKTVAFDALRHAYKHHKALLLSKDQEADRRVEEVIRKTRENIIGRLRTKTIEYYRRGRLDKDAHTVFRGFLSAEAQALKKKLSQDKGK